MRLSSLAVASVVSKLRNCFKRSRCIARLQLILLYSAICAIVQTPNSTVTAQQITNLVFPTEEELLLALDAGEITFDEYLTALELFWVVPSRISDSMGLFPVVGINIPNVDVTADQRMVDLDALQLEQLSGALNRRNSKSATSLTHGRFRVYVDQELNSNQRSRSVYQFSVDRNDRWRIAGALGESYGGDPLWRQRSVEYFPAVSQLSSVTLGTFQAQWGLGVALGRRAQLIRAGRAEGINDFLYPQKSGQNGVRALGGVDLLSRRIEFEFIHSRLKNSDHRLNLSAGRLAVPLQKSVFELIYTNARINESASQSDFLQQQLSSGYRYSSGNSHFRSEIDLQKNSQLPADKQWAGAVVVEGRYQRGADNIRWAVWRYSEDFVNLLGGGKVAALTERINLDTIGFSFSDSRNNQTGALVRSSAAFGDNSRLETTLAVAQNDRSRRADFTVGVQHLIESGATVEAKYGVREVAGVTQYQYLRTQLSKSRSANSWRVYAEIYNRDQARTGLSVFGRLRMALGSQVRADLWLNLSRYSLTGFRERSFYTYTRVAAPFFKISESQPVMIATKIAYQYGLTTTSSSRVIARIELETNW